MSMKQDIEILDSKIARLKVEYEQYFMRILKREPVKLRDEVDKIILRYSNKQISNTAFKFRYNALVSKYNSYKQYWNRILRQIDEGTYTRRAEGGGMEATPKPPVSEPSLTTEERAVEEKPAEMRPANEKPAGGNGSKDYIDDIYNKYIEARRECNESTNGITREAIERTISKNIEQVEKKFKTRDVDLNVYIKDGKTKLTITPKKKGAA